MHSTLLTQDTGIQWPRGAFSRTCASTPRSVTLRKLSIVDQTAFEVLGAPLIDQL